MAISTPTTTSQTRRINSLFAIMLDFKQIEARLEAGSLTVEQLVQGYLDTIDADNDRLNIFVEVYRDAALERAREIDGKRASGNVGKLAGMVLSLKDNICLKGHQSTASSKILSGFESLYTATAVERLLAEDAIIIGRTGCDEFAMGSSNENSVYGPVRNPHDDSRVPGGSSGGSAASVAAGMCTASLGSDTGGSIRQPASFCGVVGVKPTYGRVSRYGLIAYASSFDQIGPFSHTIDDAALLLEVMGGKDPMDSTSSPEKVAIHPLTGTKGSRKLAVLKPCIDNDGLQPVIRERLTESMEKLQSAGHTVDVVDFPYLDILVPTYYVLTTAEASSNLARYDGIHYGYRHPESKGIEDTYYASRSEGFGTEVKRRILLGTFVLSSGYYDAYYAKAQKARRLIQQATMDILKDYDFIVTPSTPDSAFTLGAKSDDPVQMYLEDIFTVQANLSGIPAVSIPAGGENGMPFGIQFMGKPFAENDVLSFSKEFINKIL